MLSPNPVPFKVCVQLRGYDVVELAAFPAAGNSSQVVIAPIDSAATRISRAHITGLDHRTLLPIKTYAASGKSYKYSTVSTYCLNL